MITAAKTFLIFLLILAFLALLFFVIIWPWLKNSLFTRDDDTDTMKNEYHRLHAGSSKSYYTKEVIAKRLGMDTKDISDEESKTIAKVLSSVDEDKDYLKKLMKENEDDDEDDDDDDDEDEDNEDDDNDDEDDNDEDNDEDEDNDDDGFTVLHGMHSNKKVHRYPG